MGKQIKEYQQNSEMLEATKLENDRLNSEIEIQVSIADNYKKLWEVYKKNAEGKVKDAKGDEVELSRRLVELEKQKQKLEESIEKWKVKAELEENKKLKLKFDYLNSENQIEKAESRATDLMEDMISIRLRHDTE